MPVMMLKRIKIHKTAPGMKLKSLMPRSTQTISVLLRAIKKTIVVGLSFTAKGLRRRWSGPGDMGVECALGQRAGLGAIADLRKGVVHGAVPEYQEILREGAGDRPWGFGGNVN